MRETTYNTRRRSLNRRPDIHVRLVATDDYGNMALCECRLTGEVFEASAGIVHGSYMAQGSSAWLDGPNSEALFDAEIAAFHENERNCNTCRDLERMPRASATHPAEVHKGRCRMSGYAIMFHPDDWMGMRCWIPRKGGKAS